MTDSHDDAAEQDVNELRSDIAETREEMSETIDELERRLDPRSVLQRRKTETRQRIDEVKRSASERADDVPVGAVAGAGGGLVVLSTAATLLRRRRAQQRLQAQQRDQAAGGAVGLAALAALLSGVKLVRNRRRRRAGVTVREVMTPDVESVATTETLVAAAERMAGLGVGSLPVCAPDGRLEGMLTDRDIVVKAVALGDDLRIVTAGQIAESQVVTVGADEPVTSALQTMARHAVRRLPVVDGHALVGVVSEADLAVYVDDEEVGDVVEDISTAPPSS